MNTFTSKLDRLEAKLQTLIEGRLSRLSPLQGKHEDLSHQLVSSMRAGTVSSNDGVPLAPDRFTLLVHPSQENFLGKDPEMLTTMGELIQSAGLAAGLHFRQRPMVKVASNKDMPIDRIDIVVRISEKSPGQTANISIVDHNKKDTIPKNAFFVVNGVDVFPLDKMVINIGRRKGNHLKIEDSRVSRQHAQVRAINGSFQIFDLDSTGGTFINQKRIKQGNLHPGDVVSLAGVYLIYGQEEATDLVNTKKLTAT